jgi:hypothetical protein
LALCAELWDVKRCDGWGAIQGAIGTQLKRRLHLVREALEGAVWCGNIYVREGCTLKEKNAVGAR